MNTRCLDLERAGGRGHPPRLGHAVADHQRVPGVVAMVRVLGDVLIHLGFERCQQHATGALASQPIQIELECGLLVGFRSDYAQHAAYLFVDGPTIARLQQPEGYAALLNSDPIHNFRLYLRNTPRGG